MPGLPNIRRPQCESSLVNEEKVLLSACWTSDLCNKAYGKVFPLLNKYLTALKCKPPVLFGSAILDIVAFINTEQYLLGHSDTKLVSKSAGTFLNGKETQ